MNPHRIPGKCALSALAAVLFAAVLAGCGGGRQQAARTSQRPGQYQPPVSIAIAPMPSSTAQPAVIASPAPVTEVAGVYDVPAQPAWQAAAGRTVILDAGHGGDDPGASHSGLLEKDVNLDLAARAANLLRARGCTVVMTRSADVSVPLPDRSAIANKHPNAVFVSIHCNATSGNPDAAGVETFVLAGEVTDTAREQAVRNRYRVGGVDAVRGKQALATLASQSRAKGPALAGALQRSLCTRLGESDRGVQSRDFAVLRETYFGPAALVEVGFMTNPRTAQHMRTDEWRRRTSEALTEGICEFLRQG
ncbi:MAG: N-acetylmuramoyl-L-alanine amidase [Planctomycetota bacterium]|jgi:N-acetylmuramoyl-L-alanine amidase|nr:N-acetylmuramoyl-L-alanine amidase [Planctomycetota bacterium]